jgi:protein gp37
MKNPISWCDCTWNPVSGCSKVSAGCTHCWAERMAKRLAGRCGYPARDPFTVTLHPERLDEPLRWRKPRMVFVCSMGDLFHTEVPNEFIARVFAIMRNCPAHTFQVLTKRPERMQQWLSRCGNANGYGWITHDNTLPERAFNGTGIIVGDSDHWPLPNLWVGTSVEDQATADERIPHLLRCPAAVRFVSYEPALGPLDLRYPTFNGADSIEGLEGLGWVIAGGETGPGARPAHPDWFRSVRDQCAVAHVPFFFKSYGEWTTAHVEDDPGFYGGRAFNDPRGGRASTAVRCNDYRFRLLDYDTMAVRVGKKAAGHLLDGREHREFPKTASEG